MENDNKLTYVIDETLAWIGLGAKGYSSYKKGEDGDSSYSIEGGGEDEGKTKRTQVIIAVSVALLLIIGIAFIKKS